MDKFFMVVDVTGLVPGVDWEGESLPVDRRPTFIFWYRDDVEKRAIEAKFNNMTGDYAIVEATHYVRAEGDSVAIIEPVADCQGKLVVN